MGIFHEATSQAIREMIEEFGEASRFGRILSDQDLDAAAARVASFLEMTLDLRAGLGLTAGNGGDAVRSSSGALAQSRGSTLPRHGHRSAQGQGRQAGPGNRLGLPSGFDQSVTDGEDSALRPSGFARTRAAADVAPLNEAVREVHLPPQHDLRLPRKRVGATEAEKDFFTSQRSKG